MMKFKEEEVEKYKDDFFELVRKASKRQPTFEEFELGLFFYMEGRAFDDRRKETSSKVMAGYLDKDSLLMDHY